MAIANAIDSPFNPFVGFHAALAYTYENVTGNGEEIPLVFQNVLLNPQGNYNASTGLYTCDRTGLYDVGGMVTFLAYSPIGFPVTNLHFVVGMQTQLGSNPTQQSAIIQPVNRPINVYEPVSVPFHGGQYYIFQEGMTVLLTAYSNNGGSDNVSILNSVTGQDIASHIYIRYIGDVA